MPRILIRLVMAVYYAFIIFSVSVLYNETSVFAAKSLDYQSVPPFVTAGVPPLVMLVMGRNHKLYFEAYNDASDLNNDGVLDVGYNPDIEYYGYFDSYKYYTYSTAHNRFEPAGVATDKKAPPGNFWSGDFLNYLTMTRMDVLRKVLYGGFRSTDTSSETVLERVYVPEDAHSWGKEYSSISHDGYDIRDYTPLDLPKGGSHHLFASTTLSDGGDPLLRVLENSVFRIWEWVAIERPVAGSQGNDGTGRRAITDNNTSGTAIDVTYGGSAGTADDSYTGGGGVGVIKHDDFNDGSIDPDWLWADHDNMSGTSHSETGGDLVIAAGGADTWSSKDEFGSVYLDNISGNFDFKLKITQQQKQNGWGKTGIMVRNDMTQVGSSTGYCMMAVTPDHGFAFQWDSNDNGYLNMNTNKGSVSLPQWVRLTKEGSLFTGYYSSDGSSWNEIEHRTINSANTVQDVGIFVTSHSSGNLSECKFDEMELSGLTTVPAPELAFDDDPATKWNYPDEPDVSTPVWIEFQFTTPIEIKSYTINAGNDAPDDWTFQGSSDQISWDVLDSVSNAGLVSGTKSSFDCDTSGAYKYYRIIITDSSSVSPGVSIAEIEMMENTEPVPATATLTDYQVRVKVCDPAVGVESNSKLYPSGVYKPIGILQRDGESNRMYFGLITGSYTKNISGGVLRKNIRSITDEINSNTGEFLYQDDPSVNGIIKTIDKFRIVGFNYSGYSGYSSYSYNPNCGWIGNRPINEGECNMWGNPVAEMMYEAMRYFAGKKSPTSEFTYGTGSNYDNNLGLPKPDWLDPYSNSEDINNNGVLDSGEDINGNGILDGFSFCAKPFVLVLSDINPTYDSDQLPGSAFGSVSSTLGTMDVESLADTISTRENKNNTTHFIGQASTYNGACTPKVIPGFGTIRGLCPEEPTKRGSYYSAAVAYYGNTEDLNPVASGSQTTADYSVGLASPLPKINISVGTDTITMVPFAKSIGGCIVSSHAEGDFQPTDTIAGFFVEEITPTHGKFRINYEDMEQGADFDMDAIVEYSYQVVDGSNSPVTDPADGVKVVISLSSEYAAGCIIQHMGYIISGTSKDGTYLEVRDVDTASGSDIDYFLDTPPGVDPGGTWNDGTFLPLTSTRTFEPGITGAATLLENPLWYAAKWGGFEDYNNNNIPDLENEWDKDGDGSPDTYFYVQNPLMLEQQLNKSFADILRRTSSGTAASVISQTRSGEGAVYQAIFYPEYKGPLGNTINWTGEIHALFVDSQGNMREDTNGNHILDTNTDRIIVFDGDVVYKYLDSDGNSKIEDGQSPDFTGDIGDIHFLWSSSTWLNEMSNAEAKSQRIYNTSTNNRYIFTFVDKNNNMVAESGEQIDFKCETLPSASDLTDTSKVYPYLTLFPTFADEPAIAYDGTSVPIDTFRGDSAQFQDFLINQSSRVVNYIRGIDQPEFISTTTPAYIIPPFRSRQADYDDDSTLETWRLGDIVYSTPTVVGRPSEGYHLLYRDSSYAVFADHFKNRRQVVYAGGNDGMFHAFNAGFYDNSDKSFKTTWDLNGDGSDDATQYELGSELWAYVPYNLLPHLYWLTETNYPHVYYCDAKPKVFDAKVFPDDLHYTDADSDPNWGTLLVAGMRLGGGEIQADMDKTDGSGYNSTVDRTMSSAYFILDITDPESPPSVIAEIKFKSLGYTTCYPAVIPMKDKDSAGNITKNNWYLVFGSGPASAGGKADINGASDALSGCVSSQTGKLFVVDLKELVLNGNLKTLDSSGVFTAAPASSPLNDYYQELDVNSFISDPISVDYNLDYNADAVYFGTVSGNAGGWGGKLRRIVINNDTDPANWDGNSVLLDLDSAHSGQPITAAPSVGIDKNGIRWIFCGTGRFFNRDDTNNTDVQSYYGIKEPFTDTNSDGLWEAGESLTWATVTLPHMIDVTSAEIDDDKSVQNVNDLSGTAVTSWDNLVTEITGNSANIQGWFLDFGTGKERNLGQAALLGDILTFTTYIPSADICSFEGQSNLYALYYGTGTAYFESVIGTTPHTGPDRLEINTKLSLGQGLAISPNIHVGMETGSRAFIQTSTGAIQTVKQINPGMTKSGVTSWKEQ